MRRQQKEQVVQELRETVGNSEFLVLLAHNGLSVAEITKLRRGLREAGGGLRVIKNTLFKRAIDGLGLDFLTEGMAGPLAMIWTAEDAVNVAKSLRDFIKEIPKVEVKTAALNSKPLSPSDVDSLADMPTIDVARAQFVGLLASVPTQFVRLLSAPMTNMGYLLMARRDQMEQA